MNDGKWIVDIKGANDDAGEISIVRESNKHGIASYGWFGENKILVASSGGPCNEKYIPVIWNALILLANSTAISLNHSETRLIDSSPF
jgi:hypothetical protein